MTEEQAQAFRHLFSDWLADHGEALEEGGMGDWRGLAQKAFRWAHSTGGDGLRPDSATGPAAEAKLARIIRIMG